MPEWPFLDLKETENDCINDFQSIWHGDGK